MFKHFIALIMCGALSSGAYAAENPVDFMVLSPFKSPIVVGGSSDMTVQLKSNLPFNIPSLTIGVPSTLTVVSSGTTCNIHNQPLTLDKPSCLLEVRYKAIAEGTFSFAFMLNYFNGSPVAPLPMIIKVLPSIGGEA
jgi:hypothetical protein